MLACWPIWSGWATCPGCGWPRRRYGSFAAWCVTASSWPTSAATSSFVFRRCCAISGCETPQANRWTKPWLHWLRHTDELSEASRWIIDRHLKRLESLALEMADIENHLSQVTAADPVVRALQSHQGIGPVTAWTLRAEIGRFDRFRHGKQLARFCGLSPRNASSGARQADAGLIKAANGRLRATLIEAAQRLIRHDPRWRQFANRLLGAGKPYCVVVAAVANRWVGWLFHPMSAVSEVELAA